MWSGFKYAVFKLHFSCLAQFDAKRRASPDPAIVPIIEEARRSGGLVKGDPAKASLSMSDEEVISFIFFPVVNEGCR